MFTPYDQLSENTKVWIYQADRFFLDDEISDITTMIHNFADNWKYHGESVPGYGAIYFNRFIVLFADDAIGGCSINTSIKLIKKIGLKYNIDFFNRHQIAYRDTQNQIKTFDLENAENVFSDGLVNENSIIFNNLVGTKRDFETNWEISAKDSYFSKYFLVNS